MRAPRPAILTACALLATAASAAAQVPGKALAEALFQEGRALLDDGKTHEACAKFDMSQRIEPKLGTLLNLASCHEQEGKTASAWAEFTEARTQAERTNQPERETFAREHADALAPRLSRILLSAASAKALIVRLDGIVIDSAAVGTPLPVDPGTHLLVVSANGKQDWSHPFSVEQGPSTISIDVPELVEARQEETPVLPKAKPRSALPEEPSAWGPDKPPGWIALGAGAIAFGVGTYAGLHAFDKKADGESHCDGAACSQEGLDAFDEAESWATASTILFGTHLAATAVGIFFLVRPAPTSPRQGALSLSVLPGGGTIRGTW